MATKFDIDKFNKAVTEGEIETPLVSIPTPTPIADIFTPPPFTPSGEPDPYISPQERETLPPTSPYSIPSAQPYLSPIVSEPLPYIPITTTPISTTPLPSISTPSISQTQKLPDTVPAPQFQETSEGMVITNLAEIKVTNRQRNDAVDALAKYKIGNSYNLTEAVINKDTKAEQAALLLFPDFNQSDLDSIKSDIREYEASQRANEVLQAGAKDWMSKGHVPLEEYNNMSIADQKKNTPLVGVTIDAYRAKETALKTQGLSEDEISWELKDYYIRQKEVTAGEYAKMTGVDKEYYSPNLSTWEYLTPWSEEKGETVGDVGWVGRAGIVAAEMIIPGVYIARKWSTMPSWERGLMIGLDVVSIIPMIGFGVRGVASGVMKGMTRQAALKQVAIAQLKAPYTIIRHPLSTLKVIPQTIKETTRVFYAPWEAVMHSRAGMSSFWSDLRLVVGTGGEVSAETLHSMQQLTRMAVADTTAKYRVGTQVVELDAVAMVKSGKNPAAISSTSFGDRWLQQTEKAGYLVPTDHANQIFASTGGTGFVDRSSRGNIGNLKAFNHIQIPDGVRQYPKELQELLHAKGGGAKAFDEEVLRLIKNGKLEPGVYGPHDIYKMTAEDELIFISSKGATERLKIYPVKTGKKTTFKWVKPDPKLLDESVRLRQLAQEKMQAIIGAEKVGDRLEAKGLHKEFDKLLDEADKVYKQAIKEGTPQSAVVDIDHLKTIDPATGEEYYVFNWSLDPKAKPWTLKEKMNFKIKGYYSIPKNIVMPQLRLPKMTGQEQMNLVSSTLKDSERIRFQSGIGFLEKALPSEIPKSVSSKWVVDFSIIESMPNKQLARDIEQFISKRPHRVYGTVVDHTQARINGMLVPNLSAPADFDVAFRSKREAQQLLKVVQDNVGSQNAKFQRNAIMVKKNGEWVKLCDTDTLANHIKAFEQPAFGYNAAKPVTVKSANGFNIEMDSVLEQLRRRGARGMLFPGWGVGEGQMGQVAAAKWTRLKDIPRFEADGRFIIQIEREKASDIVNVAKKRVRNKEIDEMELNLNRLLGVSDDTTWVFKCRPA